MPKRKEKLYSSRSKTAYGSRLNEGNTEATDVDQSADYLVKSSIAIFIMICSVYSYTTYPSIPGGDSGELLSTACERGVAHPPGYPLWTMLSIVAIKFLPFTPAYSVNLMNCITAATASALLFVAGFRLTNSYTASAISVLVFSFSPLTWTWSITGEVFALNNLFTTLLILILVEFEFAQTRQERIKMVYLGAFASGLALSNQHTIILYLPAIVCRVVYKLYQNKELSLSSSLWTAWFNSIGLTPYFYLILSSYKNSARWSWGDQTTLRGLFTHLLREEYGTFKLGGQGAEGQGFVANLVEYKRSLLHEIALPGYALACVGIVQVFIDQRQSVRRVMQTCVAMMICYVSFFSWRANLDITNLLFREVVERFWMQPNIIWALLIAMGCKLFCLKYMLPSMMKSALVMAVFASCIARSWHHCNHHADTTVKDFADSMLSSLPPDSLVLTKGDLPAGTLRYMQFCENKRPDITLIEQELMSYNWYIPKLKHVLPNVNFPGDRWHSLIGQTVDGAKTFNMLKLLDANIDQRLIFVCIGMQNKESSWSSKYTLYPYGACHQVVSEAHQWVEYKHPYNDTWGTEYHSLRNGSWEAVADEEMWKAKISKALFLYYAASDSTDKSQQLQLYLQSYKAYAQVVKTHGQLPDYFHKNYALACERMARSPNNTPEEATIYIQDAVKHFEIYSRVDRTNDPQMPNIHNVIESLRAHLKPLSS